MNVVFITKDYLPRLGGVETHVSKLTAELIKDDHKVNIITIADKGNNDGENNSGNPKVLRLSPGTFPSRLSHYAGLLKRIKILLNSDVIHLHDFSIMYYFLSFVYLLKISRKKVYITFHGWEGIFPPPEYIVKKRAKCESLADGNICIGDFIPKWYGTKADIVSYGGVEKKDITGNTETSVVFAGRLSNDTGINQYLDAWKVIQEKYPNRHLVICGDGPLSQNISDDIKSGILKNVTMAGMVKDTGEFIKDAEIVFTSGYLSILDSFAYRKKVISVYDNELKKDYLNMIPGSNEMLWAAGSKDEIFNAFEEAVKDNIKSEKAYKYALENNWEKVKNDYYRLWKK
ncbi:MAG: glycosyltransferase family 4 protein [Ignavibacteria bacterium]